MKQVGLYFGTFNPIHIGHLVIGNFMATHGQLDEVWLVVSPHNPLKDIKKLMPDAHRLQMARLAIKENENLQVCDAEFDLPKPSYTVNTMRHLKDLYPDIEFSIIMGEDNLVGLQKWRDYQELLAKYKILVYPRISTSAGKRDLKQELPVEFKDAQITLCDAPLLEISSTFIRESIRDKKDVRYLLPEAVINYISNNFLYE